MNQTWIRESEFKKIKKKAKRVFKSKFNQSPFINDYQREDVYLLENGDELHIYLQEFGFLRGGILLKNNK